MLSKQQTNRTVIDSKGYLCNESKKEKKIKNGNFDQEHQQLDTLTKHKTF